MEDARIADCYVEKKGGIVTRQAEIGQAKITTAKDCTDHDTLTEEYKCLHEDQRGKTGYVAKRMEESRAKLLRRRLMRGT